HEDALAELHELVVDLDPAAAAQDEVHLLLLPVRGPARHTEAGCERLAGHAEVRASERPPRKARLEARRQPELGCRVLDVVDVDQRVWRHRAPLPASPGIGCTVDMAFARGLRSTDMSVDMAGSKGGDMPPLLRSTPAWLAVLL